VNTVFQSYALFPHLTVLENVAFGLRRKRVRDAEARARAGLDLVQLPHLADRKPAQLSGGQQQRVALARALVNNPAVLLLDEPLGALDLKLRRQMQLELKRIQTEVGLTFIHVTHDQEEAMTMADTVAVMNHGKIEQQGSPADLYELPRTAFVANFLGQSNLVAGTVAEQGSGTIGVDVGGTRVLVPTGRAVTTTGDVLVGVRPEKIRVLLDGQQPEPGANVLGPGTVTDVAFAGVSTQYQVDLPGLGTFGVFAQNLVGGATLRVGDRVRLCWAAEFTFGLAGDESAGAGAEADPEAVPA
jgi:spermidine/putrescine transport system ATP-binding protein